jgi:glycosyltransferase involved in cell wall biosynthesis
MKKIGVLVTYYNEKELLSACLESLCQLSNQVDEILIYDDASEFPAEQYLPPFCPARIIRGSVNRGPAIGRNILLGESQSEYVHFHDADDWFHPDWHRRVSQAIETTHVDWVLTEVSSHRNNELICGRVLGLARDNGAEDFVKRAIQGAILVPSGTYRKATVQSIGGYRPDLWQSEDYDFHIRLAATNPTIKIISEPLIHIRIREDSRSNKLIEVWTSALQAIARLASELPEKYRADLAEAAAKAGSILFRNRALVPAREAFALARDLGPPEFSCEPRAYRFIARKFGQEHAERLGSFYREVLPETFRRLW